MVVIGGCGVVVFSLLQLEEKEKRRKEGKQRTNIRTYLGIYSENTKELSENAFGNLKLIL